MRAHVSADDETAISELRITSDGRIMVFGTSQEILEMLHATQLISVPKGESVSEQSEVNPCNNNLSQLECNNR